MNIVVLLGAPGSGKGTVASRLAVRLPARHVASGDLLRAAARGEATPATRKAAAAMRQGALVPDRIVDALMREQFEGCAPDAWLLLDGYPRSTVQAATLDATVAQLSGKVRRTVFLDVPE
ncbi:MAG: nucleoside monophosphate kinase, partial [Kiritimatiellae bacterium]|nr:nucleoside monophosphate kinase [Kiritimatiellia bacterium]